MIRGKEIINSVFISLSIASFCRKKYLLSFSRIIYKVFYKKSNRREPSYTVVCLIAQSCLTLCDPMDCSPPGSSVHGILQVRILEWVARLSPRGIFPMQRPNSGLPHCRWILYQQSHQGSPRKLEWVAFSRTSS